MQTLIVHGQATPYLWPRFFTVNNQKVAPPDTLTKLPIQYALAIFLKKAVEIEGEDQVRIRDPHVVEGLIRSFSCRNLKICRCSYRN
jgi:hypothetical protein